MSSFLLRFQKWGEPCGGASRAGADTCNNIFGVTAGVEKEMSSQGAGNSTVVAVIAALPPPVKCRAPPWAVLCPQHPGVAVLWPWVMWSPGQLAACLTLGKRPGHVAVMVEIGRWGCLHCPLPPAVEVGPGAKMEEISLASASGSWGISGSAEMQKHQWQLGRLWEEAPTSITPQRAFLRITTAGRCWDELGGTLQSTGCMGSPDPARLGSLPP